MRLWSLQMPLLSTASIIIHTCFPCFTVSQPSLHHRSGPHARPCLMTHNDKVRRVEFHTTQTARLNLYAFRNFKNAPQVTWCIALKESDSHVSLPVHCTFAALKSEFT